MVLDWLRSLPLRDPVSSLTHFTWCIWSVFCAALLCRLARGDRVRQLSAGCFGLSMILLYFASGLYHAVRVDADTLRYFRLADHTAIYLLIAGTYTPIFALLLEGRRRVWMLGLVWGLAAVGIACKWLITAPPYVVTVGLYLAIGWVGLIPGRSLFRAVGMRGIVCGLLGGFFYTVGAVCDACQWPVLYPGLIRSHEVLHLCDMLGTFAHVVFVIRFVLPYRR